MNIFFFFLLDWVQRGMFCLDHVKFWHTLASPSQKNVRFESALFSLEKGEGYLAYLMLSHTLKSFFFFLPPSHRFAHRAALLMFLASSEWVQRLTVCVSVTAMLKARHMRREKGRGILYTPCYGEVCVFREKPLSFWKLCVLSPEKRGVGVLFMVSCGSLCLWEKV